MNRYIQEVLDAHVVIENWLSQGEGSIEALMLRFSADFTMIPTNGIRMSHQVVSAFFKCACARRPGLKIVVDSAALLAEWQDGAAVEYCETPCQPGKEKSVRWSTVIFRQQEKKVIWQHLHETAQG